MPLQNNSALHSNDDLPSSNGQSSRHLRQRHGHRDQPHSNHSTNRSSNHSSNHSNNHSHSHSHSQPISNHQQQQPSHYSNGSPLNGTLNDTKISYDQTTSRRDANIANSATTSASTSRPSGRVRGQPLARFDEDGGVNDTAHDVQQTVVPRVDIRQSAVPRVDVQWVERYDAGIHKRTTDRSLEVHRNRSNGGSTTNYTAADDGHVYNNVDYNGASVTVSYNHPEAGVDGSRGTDRAPLSPNNRSAIRRSATHSPRSGYELATDDHVRDHSLTDQHLTDQHLTDGRQMDDHLTNERFARHLTDGRLSDRHTMDVRDESVPRGHREHGIGQHDGDTRPAHRYINRNDDGGPRITDRMRYNRGCIEKDSSDIVSMESRRGRTSYGDALQSSRLDLHPKTEQRDHPSNPQIHHHSHQQFYSDTNSHRQPVDSVTPRTRGQSTGAIEVADPNSGEKRVNGATNARREDAWATNLDNSTPLRNSHAIPGNLEQPLVPHRSTTRTGYLDTVQGTTLDTTLDTHPHPHPSTNSSQHHHHHHQHHQHHYNHQYQFQHQTKSNSLGSYVGNASLCKKLVFA